MADPVIEVALFDLDDTIFAHRRAVRDGIAAHLASTLPEVHGPDHLDRWDELEEHHYTRYLHGELTYLGQRHARAREFMQPFGLEFETDHDAERWFADYLVEYQRAWTLYDDTLPCLDALAASGVRLGIITNGILDFQLAKLDALGLTPRMEHIVTSGEFGIAKPDARIFEHACSLFGVEPSRAAYIGDRLQTDAVGASAAGLLGVWLDRGGDATAEELRAAEVAGAVVIHTLANLPGLLIDSPTR